MSGPHTTTVLITTFTLSTLSPPPNTTSLALTADFPLDTYTAQLTSFSLPTSLPDSITSLTLELFTYGYPSGFLTSLIQLLPNLRSLTLTLQLLAGTTATTFSDASKFISTALSSGLEELTLTDVFVPPDFFGSLTGRDEWCLRKLELLYTFRGGDPEFNSRLPVASIPALLEKPISELTIRILAEAEDKPGMSPCEAAAGQGVVDALMAWPKEAGMQTLDLTAFALQPETVAEVMRRIGHVKEAAWGVAVDGGETGKKVLIEAARGVSVLEVVACPGLEFYKALRENKERAMRTVLWSMEEAEQLERLVEVEVGVLRVPELGYSRWKKEEGGWVGDSSTGVELSENEKAAISKKAEGATRIEEIF